MAGHPERYLTKWQGEVTRICRFSGICGCATFPGTRTTDQEVIDRWLAPSGSKKA